MVESVDKKERNDFRIADPETCLNQDEISTDTSTNIHVNRKISRQVFERIFTSKKLKFLSPERMKGILNSNKLHIIVILLVILDCICISAELVLDLVISINSESRENTKIENFQNNTTKTNLNLFKLLYSIDSNIISILISVEHVLKFIGLGILGFFVIEISLKLIYIPHEVIKSIWGILDAIVVFVSFILDILLLKNKQLLHTVTGLLTLFRLWRIARILSGILMTMEKKSTKKVDKLLKRIEILKRENRELKEELERNKTLLESLTNNKKDLAL